MADPLARPLTVTAKPSRGMVELLISGSDFPKRDDVQGVLRLRGAIADQLRRKGWTLPIKSRVILRIDVWSSELDLDRAVTGVMTPVDSQHGQLDAAIWDDGTVDQVIATKLSPPERRPDQTTREGSHD